jgi:hypothetical protein
MNRIVGAEIQFVSLEKYSIFVSVIHIEKNKIVKVDSCFFETLIEFIHFLKKELLSCSISFTGKGILHKTKVANEPANIFSLQTSDEMMEIIYNLDTRRDYYYFKKNQINNVIQQLKVNSIEFDQLFLSDSVFIKNDFEFNSDKFIIKYLPTEYITIKKEFTFSFCVSLSSLNLPIDYQLYKLFELKSHYLKSLIIQKLKNVTRKQLAIVYTLFLFVLCSYLLSMNESNLAEKNQQETILQMQNEEGVNRLLSKRQQQFAFLDTKVPSLAKTTFLLVKNVPAEIQLNKIELFPINESVNNDSVYFESVINVIGNSENDLPLLTWVKELNSLRAFQKVLLKNYYYSENKKKIEFAIEIVP